MITVIFISVTLIGLFSILLIMFHKTTNKFNKYETVEPLIIEQRNNKVYKCKNCGTYVDIPSNVNFVECTNCKTHRKKIIIWDDGTQTTKETKEF